MPAVQSGDVMKVDAILNSLKDDQINGGGNDSSTKKALILIMCSTTYIYTCICIQTRRYSIGYYMHCTLLCKHR